MTYQFLKIGADTAENEQHFAENLPRFPAWTGRARTSRTAAARPAVDEVEEREGPVALLRRSWGPAGSATRPEPKE